MKKILIALTMGTLTITSAFAQKTTIEPDSTKRNILTFDQAVRLALQNAVLLNTQRNNLEGSQMQKLASIAGALPNVSATATASQFNGNSFNNNTGQVVNGIRDNISGQLNASLNLFSGFARMNSIRQYSNLLDAQSYFVKRTAQDVMNTVATQYLQVMLDKQLMLIAKENLTALEKQLEQIQGQVDVGSRPPVDGYNQQGLTKGAELLLVQAEITYNNDKALLAQTLLMDAFEEFDTEEPNWDVNQIGAEKLDVNALADQARANRGDYLRAVKNEKGYRYAMQSARGLMLPSLIGFLNIGSSYNRQHGVDKFLADTLYSAPRIINDPSAASGYSIYQDKTPVTRANPEYAQPFSDQFRTNNLYKQYGVQLSIPIFQGLQNRSFYVTQKVLYENAIIQRRNAELQIKNDVLRAVRNYDGARKAYEISNDKLGFAQKALDLETERYNLGVTSFVDFSNANRILVQAQTDKAQAEYKLIFQKITLSYAAGTLVSEDVTADSK